MRKHGNNMTEPIWCINIECKCTKDSTIVCCPTRLRGNFFLVWLIVELELLVGPKPMTNWQIGRVYSRLNYKFNWISNSGFQFIWIKATQYHTIAMLYNVIFYTPTILFSQSFLFFCLVCNKFWNIWHSTFNTLTQRRTGYIHRISFRLDELMDIKCIWYSIFRCSNGKTIYSHSFFFISLLLLLSFNHNIHYNSHIWLINALLILFKFKWKTNVRIFAQIETNVLSSKNNE